MRTPRPQSMMLVTPPYHAGVVESAGRWMPLSFAYLASVAEGGKLIVLLHISQPVARLTQTFGIVVSNVPVHERSQNRLIDRASTDFTVPAKGDHDLFKGVGGIDLYGSFALLAEGGNVTQVAMTSEESFADINDNNQYDEGDVVQPFCVVAAAQWEKGGVLVLGDDAMMSNAFIGKGDNGIFAANIVRWTMRPLGNGETKGNSAW